MGTPITGRVALARYVLGPALRRWCTVKTGVGVPISWQRGSSCRLAGAGLCAVLSTFAVSSGQWLRWPMMTRSTS